MLEITKYIWKMSEYLVGLFSLRSSKKEKPFTFIFRETYEKEQYLFYVM